MLMLGNLMNPNFIKPPLNQDFLCLSRLVTELENQVRGMISFEGH